MARAAFIMDGLLRKIGLTGKSFIPMMMGFGCTTSAVMATRAMGTQEEKRMTVMLTPFMSCSARLPIYVLFAQIFFPGRQALVILGLYLLGMVAAVICGLFLKDRMLTKEDAVFLMELPPYRLPTLQAAWLHMWERSRSFLIKAGTMIFAMSVVVWLLQHIGVHGQAVQNEADSMFVAIGSAIAPVFTPLGFGFWQASVALLAGLVAKEAVVSTLSVLFTGGGAVLASSIQAAFTPLSAVSFLVFCLLYMPCIAAFFAIRREMDSWRWALRTALLQLGVAYVVSLCVYQFGTLLGHFIGGV